MPKTPQSKRLANDKWDKNNMTTLGCKVKKEDAELFKNYAKQQGKTSNTLLKEYVQQCIASMYESLRQMKADPGDKLVEKNCDTCEFNFGNVCAGHGIRLDNGKSTYGMPMEEAEEMFPNGCDDYGISPSAFIEQEKMNGR